MSTTTQTGSKRNVKLPLVVNDGVPGCLFNADGWDDAIEIVQGYCKQQNIDITNINGEDWSEALESDGIIVV